MNDANIAHHFKKDVPWSVAFFDRNFVILIGKHDIIHTSLIVKLLGCKFAVPQCNLRVVYNTFQHSHIKSLSLTENLKRICSSVFF